MAQVQTYEKIGEIFRLAREAVPVAIDQVSQDLYIRVRYLRSLEAGQFHELPGPAYVKGYLLAYAHYLHLDEQEILRQFHTIEADFRRSIYFPKVLRDEKQVRPWMVISGLVVAMLVSIVWVYSSLPPPSHVENIDAWRQQLLKKGHISAFSARNEACFQQKEQLYPPCYAREQRFDLLPLNRQPNSIMEIM